MRKRKVGRPKGSRSKDKFRPRPRKKGARNGLHKALKSKGFERVSVKQMSDGNYKIIIRTKIDKKQVLGFLREVYSEFGVDNVSQYILPPKR